MTKRLLLCVYDLEAFDPRPVIKVATELKIETEAEVLDVMNTSIEEALELAKQGDDALVLCGTHCTHWAGITVKNPKDLIAHTFWREGVRLIAAPDLNALDLIPHLYIDLKESINNALFFPVPCPSPVDVLDAKVSPEPWMNEVKSAIREAKKKGSAFTLEDLTNISRAVPEKLPTLLNWQPKVTIVDSTTTLAAIIEKSMKNVTTSIDLETNGFDPFKNGILCIAIGLSHTEAAIITPPLLRDPGAIKMIREWFGCEDVEWVCHNAKFDCRFLMNNRYIQMAPPVKHDTMLLHYVLDERLGTHGLKRLSRVKLGAPDYEGYLHALLPSQETSYQYIPRKILYEYAALDVCYTLQLLTRLQTELSQGWSELSRLYAFIIEAANAFIEIENYGLLVDQKLVNQAWVDFEEEIDDKLQQLKDIVGDQNFNPKSSKQVASYLYDTLGLEEVRLFRNHKARSTAREAIDKLYALHPDVQFLQTLVDMRSVQKLHSTYVVPVKEKTTAQGRLHTDFMFHGTVTGRLASSKPNLMNVPRTTKNKYAKTIRNFFVAAPGNVYVGCDYSGMELRIATQFAEEPVWRDAFVAGRDLHAEVSSRLFGPNWTPEHRMIAKMLNFGLLYGRGADSIATERGIPLREAENIVKAYFAAVPMIARYLNWVKNEARTKGVLTTPVGRMRRFGYITKQNFGRVSSQAANYRVQSTASDCCVRAAIDMHNWSKENPEIEAKVLLLVHDFIMVECPEQHQELVSERLKFYMKNAPISLFNATYVPFETDHHVATSWGALK